MITIPAVYSFKTAASVNQPISTADWIVSAIFVVLVAIEATADQQQWNFQNEKHRRIKVS
jgi:steroid 5-alpha reductase family enzyme